MISWLGSMTETGQKWLVVKITNVYKGTLARESCPIWAFMLWVCFLYLRSGDSIEMYIGCRCGYVITWFGENIGGHSTFIWPRSDMIHGNIDTSHVGWGHRKTVTKPAIRGSWGISTIVILSTLVSTAMELLLFIRQRSSMVNITDQIL